LSKQPLSRFDSICFSEEEEEETSHDRSPPFKERVEVLGLVANGRRRRRFLARWSMEGEGKGSWLGGQWKEKEKVLGLVVNGRTRRRFFSTSSHFPLKHLLQLPFFILDIKVLLCPSPRPLFTPSLCFPWPINYDCTS
jgi:hypothetical protein